MSLDKFVIDEEKLKKDVKDKTIMDKEELKEKIEKYKIKLLSTWGTIDFLDFDSLSRDADDIPFISIGVDKDVVKWINDLISMTGTPYEQVIVDAIMMYHSLLSFSLYKVTGDPLYRIRKKNLGETMTEITNLLSKEVEAIKSRLSMIEELKSELEKRDGEKHDENDVGRNNQAELSEDCGEDEEEED